MTACLHSRSAVRGLLLATMVALPLVSAPVEDIELANLPTPLDEIADPFPMDLSNIILNSTVTPAPLPGQPALDPIRLMTVIDTDRTTGLDLSQKGEHRFMLHFGAINRVRAITITGNLRGATATVQVADLPLNADQTGWTTLFSGKVLDTPATSVSFGAQAAHVALITINTGSAQESGPALSDIAFYATPDYREYQLVPNPNKKVEQKKENNTDQEKFQVNKTVHQDEFDLASMYAGAKVSHVSSAARPDEANYMNDGNANTIWQFDPKETDSVAVLDLGQSRRVRKVSMVHSQKPGEISLYVVDHLPWEQEAPTKQVAWLDPVLMAGSGPVMSDFPMFAQAAGAGPAKTFVPAIIQVKAAWFQAMTRFGSAASETDHFTQISSAPTGGRYVIVRFLNRSPSQLDGFQINDINVFGDYEKDDFILIPKDFGEPTVEALIINTTPAMPPVPPVYPKVPPSSPTPAPAPPPAS